MRYYDLQIILGGWFHTEVGYIIKKILESKNLKKVLKINAGNFVHTK